MESNNLNKRILLSPVSDKKLYDNVPTWNVNSALAGLVHLIPDIYDFKIITDAFTVIDG